MYVHGQLSLYNSPSFTSFTSTHIHAPPPPPPPPAPKAQFSLWSFSSSNSAEVCFEDLGCFSDEAPWGGTPQRPIARLPWSPEEIGTRFLLFTQKNRYYQEIKPDKQTMKASNYSGYKKTRFVIPGYLQRGDEDWPQEMCKSMLTWENVNCIAVEWKKGVQTQYAQAVNNGRVVSAQVAFMLNFIKAYYRQTADKFELIGHSLGAHVAGETGSLVGGLARITGLDPTEPYFQDCDISVRLDTTDATFVDVIHTDGLPFNTQLGLGMSEAIGHVDFYPNGGELMPGCSKNKGKPTDLDAIWEGTKKFDACNHVRAYQYFEESLIKSRGFVAYPCSDKDTFAAGKCFPCADKCPLMGLSADKHTVTEGVNNFFLTTGNATPFGRYSYRATVTLDGPVWPNPGFMYLALVGGDEVTQEHQLHVGMLSPGSVYEVLINAEVDVGEVTEMRFRWNNHIWNPMVPKYGASKIELVRGKDRKTYHFCGTGNVAENAIQSVLPCQKRSTDPIKTRQALDNFSRSITELKDKLASEDTHPDAQTAAAEAPRRTRRCDNVAVAAHCCDIMIKQSKARFEKARHLESFELIDPELFPTFKTSFPQKQLDIASESFPMICKEKLKSELMVMYSSAEFAALKSAMSLLRMLTENNLQSTFSETLKLTQINITTPVTSAESERCFSTLKRIKSFLRSKMGQDRLNALAMLSIEREFIRTPDFNDMVIDMFAAQKTRRCELLFK
ncbi:inactive pancreatic lipase-related protein 1-like [Diretmus argenteus]